MQKKETLKEIQSYFQSRLDSFGTSPRGADWNSVESQYTRFAQLAKVIDGQDGFSILDFGCGYGAFADYLGEHGFNFSVFHGVDILTSMVEKARELHPDTNRFQFSTDINSLPRVDYAVASGVFNVRLQSSYQEWTEYVFQCLEAMNVAAERGFSSNFLTKYSDPEKMADRLYYADPCVIFDYCKKRFSKNVALLHDYTLYDFTIIVRK